jgi:methylglutaconyl-CoA hydratase
VSAFDTLRYDESSGVVRIVLDRPERRNALDARMIAELLEAFDRAERDPVVRVITLAGAGGDFCAGADLAELKASMAASLTEGLAEVDQLSRIFTRIRALRVPVVALVQGRALAGGAGLALACDLVLASERAELGFPEIAIGFVPAIVLALLRRNITEKQAFEMIALGESLGAERAEQLGLVNRVYPDSDFAESVERVVASLRERSPIALQLAKRLLYHQDGMSFEAALRAGGDVNLLARATPDAQSGVAYFLERRQRS